MAAPYRSDAPRAAGPRRSTEARFARPADAAQLRGPRHDSADAPRGRGRSEGDSPRGVRRPEGDAPRGPRRFETDAPRGPRSAGAEAPRPARRSERPDAAGTSPRRASPGPAAARDPDLDFFLDADPAADIAAPSPALPAASWANEDDGGADARSDSALVWLHGVHPVAAALANPARRLRRLLLTESGRAALIPRLPPPWRIGPEPAEKENLARLLGAETVHQGCALLVEPLEAPPLERFLEHSAGPVLVLDQVTDPRNIGAILRSAAAFGAAGVVLQERHAPGETGALARAASGALEAVPILREVNLARALRTLKEAGLWVVGLEAGGPVTLAQAAQGLAGRRVALVLGAEGEGLRRLTRETCDELARLPIRPAMESLNVAAAAAVALYELTRE